MDRSPEFLIAIPVLPALDLTATVSFYEQRLGFQRVFLYDDYASVERSGIQIHFWLCDDRRIPENSGCRITVSGIETLYAEYERQGTIHPKGTLSLRPWGLREFVVLDLN